MLKAAICAVLKASTLEVVNAFKSVLEREEILLVAIALNCEVLKDAKFVLDKAVNWLVVNAPT